MKKVYALFAMIAMGVSAQAQIGFDPEIDFQAVPDEVIVPPSPIQSQVIFIGGTDSVQTTATYGNPAGAFPAKQWHDFIGFTPDTDAASTDLGWLSINHEMIYADPNIGDGGGMTVFKIRRNAETDSIEIVEQTLADGRTGKFFNVDFVNTVGETGMNCGGITSEYDGRIWTAEEWFRSSNSSIASDFWGNPGVSDTADFTISGSGIAAADGETIAKYENFNWMVEIDPREAVAIRKQYNWGRQPFEGGVVMPDNQTVFLGADNTPGVFSKFVADNPGDFTEGTLYVYREDDKNLRLSHSDSRMDTHSEISAYDPATGLIYSTESNIGGVHVSQLSADGTIDSVAYVALTSAPTSVDVYNGVLAIALPAAVEQDLGSVLLYNTTTLTLENTITVGALPDMLKFSPNGNYLVVANEGEPSDDYTNDPDGTVSVIDMTSGAAAATVATANFDAYNMGNIPAGVRIFGNGSTDVSADLEPEYVAINGASTTAYVACQENNAIAVVDLQTASVTGLIGLGYKDYGAPGNYIDPSDDDNIIGNFQYFPNVYGMYQPDAIAIANIGGTEYIVTANEGDARDYSGYSEEDRVGDVTLDPVAFPNASYLQNDTVLGRLKITLSQGDIDNDGDYDVLYSYGARSFSIWDLSGNLVYDSGSEFGEILAGCFSGNYADNRDDDKGSEPESIAIGTVGGKTFAFIGLERAAGVMVYDITDPANSEYVHYFNNNDTDESPEGLVFVDGATSPTGAPVLLSTNEPDDLNGSISAYNVNGFDGSNWVEVDSEDFDRMLKLQDEAMVSGATMYNRLEWVAYNPANGHVYMTETGRDNPGSRWTDEACEGGTWAAHHVTRGAEQGTTPDASDYVDYYGRVLEFDPVTDSIWVALEAGPQYHSTPNVDSAFYPNVHLSNPDGLTFMTVGSTTYMVICEDLNGTSHGRMPAGQTNRACELFLLDMSIANPSLDDLIRIAQVPAGAEVTGCKATPDGKTLFFNSQHPSSSNPFPYNNSLTIALTGWDQMDTSELEELEAENDMFRVYPNPTSRYIYFTEMMDVALYDTNGKLIRVERNTKSMDIIGLNPGTYYVQNAAGLTKKLVIQ